MRTLHATVSVVTLLISVGCATTDTAPRAGNALRDDSAGTLFQVIVNVKDMGAQIAFYRDLMGLPIVYPQGVDDYTTQEFVRFDTGGAYLVLHAGRSTDNVGDEPRLSFMTTDLHGFRERLLAEGIVADEIRSPAPGVLVVDARDPEGNAFHLESRVEPGEEASYLTAAPPPE